MSQLFAALFLVALLSLPVPTIACSLAACVGNGVETQRTFVIRVSHGGKPLTGVSVRVAAYTEDQPKDRFSGKTGANGTVRVVGLMPGNYWLSADLLGISAGSECFHVGVHSSWRAKRKVEYDWGDLAPSTRQFTGKLIDSQPGHGENPIMNLIHRIDVPISGARMRLQDPLTGKVYNAVSDDNGEFAFDSVPKGIYVLHIDSGTVSEDRNYDSTDLLLRLSDTAKPNSLLLKRREAGGGSCGGTYLELQKTSS